MSYLINTEPYMTFTKMVYYETLEDILKDSATIDKTATVNFCIPSIHFDSYEMAKAYADSIEAELGEGCIEEIDERKSKTGTFYRVRDILKIISVWELVNGKVIGKGTAREYYITPHHGLLSQSQLFEILRPIYNEFKKYSIDSD